MPRRPSMETKSSSVVYPPQPIALSAEEERSIETLANHLVVETLHASENFAAQGYVADPNYWKAIKKKDRIVAYQNISTFRGATRESDWSERTDAVTASPQNPSFFLTSGKSLQDALLQERFHNIDNYDSEDETHLHHDAYTKFGAKAGLELSAFEKFRPANVPVVFSSGVFPGSTEDMALAFLADTDERSRTRYNTSKDVVLDDVSILARIQGPTMEDPFRFLGIKWCEKTPKRVISFIVNTRDYVVIESTGMALDSNGERFAYMLNHSIELDEVPPFRDVGSTRIVFSSCHIVRPDKNLGGTVEIYSRGYLVMGGSFSSRAGATHLAEGFVNEPILMEEAYLKKLVWMTHEQRRWEALHSNSCNDAEPMHEKSSHCPSCFEKLVSRLGSFRDSSTGCGICRKIVCHKCALKRSLPMDGASGRNVKRRDLKFCVTCYLKAKRLPAWNIAVAMLSASAQ